MRVADGGFDQCYNAQAVVDHESMLVVVPFLTQAGNDKEQVQPAVGCPQVLVGDNGFFSEKNVMICHEAGVEPMLAVGREGHHPHFTERFGEPPPLADQATMQYRLKTTTGRAVYALRKQTVETVFGIIKSVMGFRQFSLHGLEKVRHEWTLVWEGFDAHVIGVVPRDAEGGIDVSRLVLPLRDRDGAVAAWCLALPFLRMSDVPHLETTGDAYLEGIAELYRQAQDHALTLRQPGQAIVALGHCHMAGGQMSEHSERRIVIGGAEMLSGSLFGDDVAYAALGHLHLAQRVGGGERIRYSGSPLPLSFSEVRYPHQVLQVELVGASLGAVEAIEVPRAVALLRVPEHAAPLAEVEAALAALDLPEVALQAMPYLEVRVRLDGPEPGLRARIEAALEGKPVRLARIDTASARPARDADSPAMSLDDLGQLEAVDLFRAAYSGKYAEAPPDALLAALNEILHLPEDVTP